MANNEKKYLTAEQWCRIITLTWLDDQFESDFLTNPRDAVQKKFGWTFTHMIKVPPKPKDLNPQQLNDIVNDPQKSKAVVIPYNTSSC